MIYRGNLVNQRTTLQIRTPKPSMLEGRSSPIKIYWQADGERCLASARILTPSSANYLRVCSAATYSQQQTGTMTKTVFRYFISSWRETHPLAIIDTCCLLSRRASATDPVAFPPFICQSGFEPTNWQEFFISFPSPKLYVGWKSRPFPNRKVISSNYEY